MRIFKEKFFTFTEKVRLPLYIVVGIVSGVVSSIVVFFTMMGTVSLNASTAVAATQNQAAINEMLISRQNRQGDFMNEMSADVGEIAGGVKELNGKFDVMLVLIKSQQK